MAICKENGIPLVEEAFTTDEIALADEMFLSSTTSEVTPIIEVDGKAIGNGIGEWTRKLQAQFAKKIPKSVNA